MEKETKEEISQKKKRRFRIISISFLIMLIISNGFLFWIDKMFQKQLITESSLRFWGVLGLCIGVNLAIWNIASDILIRKKSSISRLLLITISLAAILAFFGILFSIYQKGCICL